MTKRNNNRARGSGYEDAASSFMMSNGFEILDRNWTAGHKEIDLIARKDDLIVFVEVKSSRDDSFGHPAERVDFRKQQNLIIAAETYIMEKEITGYDIRFDLITFLNGKLEYYPGAFQAE